MPKTRRRTLIIALTAALTLGAAVAATVASAATGPTVQIEQGGCPGEAQRIMAEQPAANPLMCY